MPWSDIKSEFPLTFRTAWNPVTESIDNFISKSLKDLSCNKGGYAVPQGAVFICTWNALRLSQASALQPAMTTCRYTSTTSVWVQMGSAHYVGSPTWTAITCETALNLFRCI
ncbi:hypothetical protein CDAR_167411 [Caerostris darwini]|uniref:Uncharacterized protein n=1 Tax=Caerostris darwini TaxID=1538125 RepID=A0AAV4QD89_9ARAC|nr:hypothetical protein CDAR_167411 [Caerostris darwini]